MLLIIVNIKDYLYKLFIDIYLYVVVLRGVAIIVVGVVDCVVGIVFFVVIVAGVVVGRSPDPLHSTLNFQSQYPMLSPVTLKYNPAGHGMRMFWELEQL